jgi:hypothetical protein
MSCFYFFPENERQKRGGGGKCPFYPSSLTLIPSSFTVFLYSRNPFAVACKETTYFVLCVEKMLVSATMPEVLTPAHSKINTMLVALRHNFSLVIEIFHAESHSYTKGWHVCTVQSF